MRDTKFPKLQTESKSFFLNIALQATGFSSPNTRFAFELFLMLPSVKGSKTFSSRFIDDQYTPGRHQIFKESFLDRYRTDNSLIATLKLKNN